MIITVVSTYLVGTVYSETKGVIAAKALETLNASYTDVYPLAQNTKKIHDAVEGTNIVEIYETDVVDGKQGVIFIVAPTGYAGEIRSLVAFEKSDGKLTGMKVLQQSETPGLGANCAKHDFCDHFKNKDSKNELVVVKTLSGKDNEIQAITASTITSKAVVNGVNDARVCFLNKYSKDAPDQKVENTTSASVKKSKK